MALNPIQAKLPVKYEPELALSICELVASGMSLAKVCELPAMPARGTVYKWLSVYPKFFDAYERAREVSAQSLEDEALEMARTLAGANDFTGTKVTAYSVAMQQLRWSASHRDPNRYGQKQQTNGAVPITITTTLNLGQDGKPATDAEKSIYTVEIGVSPTANEARSFGPPEPEVYTIDLEPVPADTDDPPTAYETGANEPRIEGLPFGLPQKETQQLYNPKPGRPKGTNKGVIGKRKSAAAIKRTASLYAKKGTDK